MRVGALLASLLVFFVSATIASTEPPSPADAEFFESKVRPLLVERCSKCHGGEKQKGGLRLDSREAILKGGDNGPAVEPGKPGDSLLIDAVNYGETVQMPPKSRLPATEVETLTRWVEMGVPWPAAKGSVAVESKAAFDLKARRDAHWAWQPVRSQPPPAVKSSSWPLGPIDRFVLARLEASALHPAPDADRRVLIRRLTFDLIGLPPTPGELTSFLQDDNTGAYESLVDRLLASPRFGERWGRHWLDLVRYAETRGHEFDPAIPNAWQYRDYVTRALNRDVPYDQFLVEHIAGDLVEPPRVDPITRANESILGTGFWFLGEEVHSPVDLRQDEADRLDNRLDVMSKTFLGLTVACARCHDHKFDAISQRDYYALIGFLHSSSYRQARFTTIDAERDAAKALESFRLDAGTRLRTLAARTVRPGIEALAQILIDAVQALPVQPLEGSPDRTRRWATELRAAQEDETHPFNALARLACNAPAPESKPLDTEPTSGRVIVDFGALESLSRVQDGVAYGLVPERPGDVLLGEKADSFRIVNRASARRDPAWNRLALLDGTERDHGRLGTWDRSGQTLRTPEFTIETGRLWYLAEGAGRAYAAVNSHSVIAGPLHNALLTEWTDGHKGWRWVRHDLAAYKGQRAHIEFCPSGGGPHAIARVVDSEHEPPLLKPASGVLGTGQVASVKALALHIQAVLNRVVDQLENGTIANSDDPQGESWLADWILQHRDLFGCESLDPLDTELASLRKAHDAIAQRVPARAATAPVMLDGSASNAPLLVRGSSKTPGPVVWRGFLEAIDGAETPEEPAGSGRLELARRMVDRSNPFASRVLVNRVWHHLFGRGIVASVDNFGVLGDLPTHPELLDFLAETFVNNGWSVKRLIRSIVLSRTYRMSSRVDEQEALDPDDRLLHRMRLRRLEAESIRDAILAVSGRLDDRMYGPSVPLHLTPFMQGRGRPSKSGPIDGDGRRSLYLATRRNFLAPMMLAFDAPIPFTSMGRRNVSNVPAQALILMNDPFVVDQARRWAGRVLELDAPASARVAEMYRAAFARQPRESEIESALAFLSEQAKELGLPDSAWQSDRRVWADLAHVLFNAKEFLFVE